MSLRIQNRRFVEKYFDFSYDQAKCKLCKQMLKANRTFNLKVHLKKMHRITEDEFKKSLKAQFGVDLSKLKIKKQTIKVEACKKEMIRSYIGLVTEDSLPFEFLDSENFAVFVDPLCQGVNARFGKKFRLNSNNCKHVLKLVADKFRADVKYDVFQRLLSLKVDCANGLSRNLFGISVQFIKKSEVQSHFLGLAELRDHGGGTTRSLAADILSILSSYDISLNQIVSTTLGNSADIIKTTQILSQCDIFEHGCEGQSLDEGNDMYLKKIQLFEDTAVIDLGEIQVTRCLALAAQLCILDVIKKPEMASYIFSCRNFVKFIQKPTNGFAEILDQQNLMLPQLDCPTKWGSTYTMIESVKFAKSIFVKLEPFENKSNDENFVLNESFWNFVEAFCVAFEPIQLIIIKFQEELLHYGNFYAEWLKCKLCTEKLLENSTNVQAKNIIKVLLQSMENRTKELLSNESLLACLFLDPRFNHTLTLTKKLQAIAYLKKIHEKIKHVTVLTEQIKTEEISITASSSQISQMETAEFSQKADEYLNEYLTRNFVPNSGEGVDVALKLENLQMPFCRVDSNVLQFWLDKQYSDPEVYALSNVCFAIPANQIPMDHIFSSLKNIFADIWNNRDTLDNIIIVKQNPVYLDLAIETLPLFVDEN